MSSTVVVQSNDHADPSLVVFGRDEAGKPRASWFDAVSADLATKAADLTKMRVLKIETEEQKVVARQLAPGRVLESGRAFTPFARATVFSKLVELAHVAQQAHGPSAGTEVAASTGNGLSAAADGFGASSSGGGAANAPKWPVDWDEIGVGSVVLALEAPEYGWWESIVIGVNGQSVSLKWRDYPREPVFVRPRAELALLPVATN